MISGAWLLLVGVHRELAPWPAQVPESHPLLVTASPVSRPPISSPANEAGGIGIDRTRTNTWYGRRAAGRWASRVR
jgi:hypothetical protein